MDKTDNGFEFRKALSVEALTLAFRAQSLLLDKYVATVNNPYDRGVSRVILSESAEIFRKLTGAELCSLILFDSDGQMDESILSRGEIAADQTREIVAQVLQEGLAGWVVTHQVVGLVENSARDDRWIDLPDQPYEAGSAICLPIISAEQVLGVLTLTHSQPAYFNQEMVDVMNLAVNQIALIIENVNLFNHLSDSFAKLGETQQSCQAYSRQLDRELEKCRRIQMDFLPAELPQLPGWDIQDFFFPANRASGDFYDAFSLPGGYVGFVVADVCDKGVGAALFMGLFRSLLRIFSGQARLGRLRVDAKTQTVGGEERLPDNRRWSQLEAIRAVALTNDYIAREHGEMCMFATLFFGVLDAATGRLVYINGGHEPVFVIDAQGIQKRLRPTGPAVGVFPQTTFGYRQIELHPGETIFGFTDGVLDARSTEGKRFGRKRLVDLLSQPAADAAELMERIGTTLFAHIGMAPQEDDITMLAIQRRKNVPD
ncbi:MAG: SpoIIE family protein phosphatase [Desulfobacterales bacterium]|nr:SpoIIE family protein phosphatase [Desulfobacterales bacterium]